MDRALENFRRLQKMADDHVALALIAVAIADIAVAIADIESEKASLHPGKE